MVLLLISQFSIKIFHEEQKAPRWTQLFPGSAPFYWLKRKNPVELKAKEHSRARNQAAITNRHLLCTKYKACRLDDHLPFILSDPDVLKWEHPDKTKQNQSLGLLFLWPTAELRTKANSWTCNWSLRNPISSETPRPFTLILVNSKKQELDQFLILSIWKHFQVALLK